MASPTTDRRLGLVGNTAIKAPVRVLAASNITLSGLQTIDGVALAADDRVLVTGQNTASENGIYDASTSAWTRSKDANGNYDFVTGTTVQITEGSNYAGSYWRISTTGTITIGTTSISWARALASALSTLSFLQAGSGAVTRGAQDKQRDIIDVKDYGVTGDDSTNNKAAYDALIAHFPDGTTFRWSEPGTYKGRFLVTSKAFNLDFAPGVVLKTDDATSTDPVIRMQGTLAAASALGAAPAYGNTSLTGTAGLAAGDLVLLYSGNVRPSDSEAVNYEVVRMLDGAGNVEGQIYSAQTGGSPTYAKITPIENVRIGDVEIDLGESAGTAASGAGIFVRYAYGVKIGKVKAVGGKNSSVRVDSSYDVHIERAERMRPYSTTSGNGYHVALNNCTKVKAGVVYGVGCRHTWDADSCYLVDVDWIVSHNAASSDIPMTHNGFGGAHTYHRVDVINPSNYAIHTSSQGISVADLAAGNQIARDFKIKQIFVNRTAAQTSAQPSVYFQYGCKDVEVNGKIINPDGGSFASQMAIRFAGPVGGKSRVDAYVESHDWGVYFDNSIDAATSYPRSGEQVTVRINGKKVKRLVFDNTLATCYLYLLLDDPQAWDDASYHATFEAFLRVAAVHNGNTHMVMRQAYSDRSSNKIVVNSNGHNVAFHNQTINGLGSTLTPASNTLTQTDLLTAGTPCGRILAASTVTTVDRGCGKGQAVRFLCNGAVSISDAATVTGTITANVNEVIEMLWSGSTWRQVNPLGTW